MDLYRAKLITTVLAYGMLIAGVIGATLFYVFPQFFPNWFEVIVVYFLVIQSLIVAYVEGMSKKANQKQLLNVYLLTKVCKILVSLAFVGIYAAVVKDGIKNFVLIFMTFYILFLFIETKIFTDIEKRLKNKKVE